MFILTPGIQLIQRLHHGGGSLHEVVAALEADMEAMYEMIDRYGGGGSSNTADNSGATSSNNTNDANSERQVSVWKDLTSLRKLKQQLFLLVRWLENCLG